MVVCGTKFRASASPKDLERTERFIFSNLKARGVSHHTRVRVDAPGFAVKKHICVVNPHLLLSGLWLSHLYSATVDAAMTFLLFSTMRTRTSLCYILPGSRVRIAIAKQRPQGLSGSHPSTAQPTETSLVFPSLLCRHHSENRKLLHPILRSQTYSQPLLPSSPPACLERCSQLARTSEPARQSLHPARGHPWSRGRPADALPSTLASWCHASSTARLLHRPGHNSDPHRCLHSSEAELRLQSSSGSESFSFHLNAAPN